jgi:hypothetical protein|tara:strand:+ start:213 stop:536 length:324 start_codon:yes stop_codon:yes gene_type:complete
MAASESSKIEIDLRVQKLSRIIATGGRRSDCLRYARENWGVSEATVDNYLKKAREDIKKDWDIERPQMIADLLAQCSTLQMEARRAGQFHIALGAINTAAKLADLCS